MTGLDRDLEHILAHTEGIWREFTGASVFITGGTGFFGNWLLPSFVAANERFGLSARAVVLTRDADGFRRRVSHPSIAPHAGDVRTFKFPAGRFSHVIHAATPANAALNAERPLEMRDIIVEGTRHVLEFARQCSAAKLLFCSSGAVYGRQPPELEKIPEDYTGPPADLNDPRSLYGQGKLAAELLCAGHSRLTGMESKIARCFAFVGPHLPLDTHYAIGNFIRDAMAGRPIEIQGDGTPYRSYLYAADLMIWLWTILARGQPCRAYNVGSESAIHIADLARLVARTVAPGTPVHLKGTPDPDRLPDRYVPSTDRARSELGLTEHIGLEEAIRRTAAWHRR